PDPDGRRRPAGRPREIPRLAFDDDRPGAVRDGTGRPRLLRLPRQRLRQVQRGLPSPRLRLRCHPPRRRIVTGTSSEHPRQVTSSREKLTLSGCKITRADLLQHQPQALTPATGELEPRAVATLE